MKNADGTRLKPFETLYISLPENGLKRMTRGKTEFHADRYSVTASSPSAGQLTIDPKGGQYSFRSTATA